MLGTTCFVFCFQTGGISLVAGNQPKKPIAQLATPSAAPSVTIRVAEAERSPARIAAYSTPNLLCNRTRLMSPPQLPPVQEFLFEHASVTFSPPVPPCTHRAPAS